MLYDPKRWSTDPTPQTDEPWRDVLRRAADEVERRGLAKGMLCDEETGAVCARGAIVVSLGYHPGFACLIFSCSAWDEFTKADDLLETFLGLDPNGVPRWNNAPSRTQAEVVAALRGAAEWRG